jgi:outer membrane protein assembly factor BamB
MQITALDDASGHTQWSQTYANVESALSVVAAAGVICLSLAPPNAGEAVTALRGSDGAALWSATVNATMETLVVNQNAVYVDTIRYTPDASQLYAYTLNGGAPLWNTTIPAGFFFADAANAQTLYLAATTSYGANANTLMALDASNGALKWKQPISGDVLSLALAD